MKNIWIIGYDGDDGQVVEHVFSSKEKAEKFKDLLAMDSEIFELDVDPYEKEISNGLIPYRFYLDMYGNPLFYSNFQKNDCFTTTVDIRLTTSGLEFVCNVVAKNTDEALQIAREKVIEILKSDKWSAPIDGEIAVRESIKDSKGQHWYATSFMGNLEQAIEYKKQLALEIEKIIA